MMASTMLRGAACSQMQQQRHTRQLVLAGGPTNRSMGVSLIVGLSSP